MRKHRTTSRRTGTGTTTIYQIYRKNGCRLGFFVRRSTWEEGRYAKVVGIQFISAQDEWLKPVNSRNVAPFGLTTLRADWLIGGIVEIDSGWECCWEEVDPTS